MSGEKRKVKVETRWAVEIEVPFDWTEDDITFYVEENGCPGTGSTGSALEDLLEVTLAAIKKSHDKGFCWACGDHIDYADDPQDRLKVANGESKVLAIAGMDYKPKPDGVEQ
jgi:hypothetical protein